MSTSAESSLTAPFRSFRTSPAALARAEAPTRLVSVIRVSQVNGRSGDSFLSPVLQRGMIDGYLQSHDIELVKEFDETGVSGGTTDREGLQGAIAMIMAGEADGLIVARLSRFVRETEMGLAVVNLLSTIGTRLIAVEEGIDTSDRDMIKDFLLTVMLGLGQMQRAALAKGWVDVREKCVIKGVPNHSPFGYVKSKQQRRLVFDEAVVAGRTVKDWVIYIFERRAAGANWSALAEELTEAGLPTPTRLIYDRWVSGGCVKKDEDDADPAMGGTRWDRTQVRKMVSCRTYLGELASGKEDPKDHRRAWFWNGAAHDPLITQDLWNRAHLTQKTAQRSEAEPFQLAGIVRCASCGGRMRGATDWGYPDSSGVKEKTRYRYYRCARKYGWGMCTNPALVRAADLDRLVLEAFRTTFLDRDLTSTATADTDLLTAQEAVRIAQADLIEFASAPSTARLRREQGDEVVDLMMERYSATLTTAKVRVEELLRGNLANLLPNNLGEVWAELLTDLDDGKLREERRHLLAIAFPVVAVWPGDRSVPVDERIVLFDQSSAPSGLPGGHRGTSQIRPINRPAGF
jgi:DNA invertase Pin-like site-specific DNA recombinase